MIYCWMTVGQNLPDEVLDVLFYAARHMLRNSKKRRKFEDNKVHYEITTKFESTGVGGTSGILFAANVITPIGATNLTYSIRPQDCMDEQDDQLLKKRQMEGSLLWMRTPVHRPKTKYDPSNN